MDGLIFFAGAMVIGFPMAVIYLLISHWKLKETVSELKKAILLLEYGNRKPDETKASVETKHQKTPQITNPEETPDIGAKPSGAAGVIAARRAEARNAIVHNSAPEDKAKVDNSAIIARGPTLMSRLFNWLSLNWFYAVSALSLALAGLFLVQYGMENGLLPPAARVASALGFGAALIAVGEYIRRRFGEDVDSTTAYLPSVFAGAGIVSLFGAVVSAQMLYGLIGGTTALIGLVATAIIALVLGWFYGPLLAAIGVIGAFGAPMVLGDSGSDPTPLFVYFALVTLVGLGVDTLRRWAWVSGLTVVMSYAMATLLIVGDHTLAGAYQLYLVAIAVMTLLIPARSFVPDHAGHMVSEWLVLRRNSHRPIFPIFLALAALTASSILLVLTSNLGEAEFWLSVLALAGLSGALIVWSLRGPALQDLSFVPLVGLFLVTVVQSDYGVVMRAYLARGDDGPEAAFPIAVSALVGIGLILSTLAAWRSLSQGNYPVVWAACAAIVAPAMGMVLEMGWEPSKVIEAYPWALHGAVMAIFMAVWAERFAKIDGAENRLRMSFFVLSVLASISFALVMVLSSAALTVALAITVVAAAALDQRFDLRPMTLYITAGIAGLGYRLIADPGLDWARYAPFFEMIVAYGGVLAAMITSLWLLRDKERESAKIMLDSAAWSVGGVLASLIIYRALEAITGTNGSESHWGMGIYATIWITLALTQAKRLQISGPAWMRQVRIALGSVFAVIGVGALALTLTLYSPLLMEQNIKVAGPAVFNTLAIAFLLPALVMLIGIKRITTIPVQLRLGMQGLSGLLILLWAFGVVRHFWQGATKMPLENGMTQPELYSYTIALLLIGGGLFYQSLASQGAMMRRAGLGVIGAAVAKVFLIDISGLEGLTRVFSLLVLGLSLAGLAWLNRWAQDQVTDTDIK